MNGAAALYTGTIRHRRFAPRAHQFEYSLFMVLLDVDRLREAMGVSRLTSYNGWNWASFDERDHIGDPSQPLRDRLRESAASADEVLPDGPIYILTHLRYVGYVFNPISLYYCYDRSNRLRLVLADVRNTYGGRCGYWLRSGGDRRDVVRETAAKSLYVSPFMDYDVDYDFVLTPPGPTLVAHMNVTHRNGGAAGEPRLFDATLRLTQQPWTARAVRTALARWPWMTAKVIAAIYWQALRLRLKGVPVVPPQEDRL